MAQTALESQRFWQLLLVIHKFFLFSPSLFAERDVEIPDHFDIFHLRYEIEASEKTALQAVLDVEKERKRLEAEADKLIEAEMADCDQLQDIYERLDNMDASRGIDI